MKKSQKRHTSKSKIFLILTVAILAISATIYFLNEKSRNNKEVSKTSIKTLERDKEVSKISIEVLGRAKEMLANLPASEDTYGLKQVFNTAEVVPAIFNGKGLQMTLVEGQKYIIVFCLPNSQDDYQKFGGPDSTIMYVVNDSNDAKNFVPVYAIINPQRILEYSKDEKSLDYLASVMLHETVHLYQRSLALRNGQKVSYSLEAVKQREKEAYSFQAKFLNQILFRNKIDTKVLVPMFDIKKINKQGLSTLCGEVDRLNGYKLGPIASLIVFNAYPDIYVSIANIQYRE